MKSHLREETLNNIFQQALLRVKHRKATLPQIVEAAGIRFNLIHAMEATCLNGPRVLGRLAPSQEALDIFIFNASPQDPFAGWAMDYTAAYAPLFSPFPGPSDEQIKEACLRGPCVLGRLAPTQEALNRFIYPYLSFQQQYEIYPVYTMASRYRDRNPMLPKP